MPAWTHIGVVPWTVYLRTVNSGMGWLLYPAIGLVALLATVATAVSVHFDTSTKTARKARFIAYLAAGISVASAIVTRAAAVPLLTQVMSSNSSVSVVEAAFAHLKEWWILNDALHTAAFVCNLSALVAILSGGAQSIAAADGNQPGNERLKG
jgi:hypothetical protein